MTEGIAILAAEGRSMSETSLFERFSWCHVDTDLSVKDFFKGGFAGTCTGAHTFQINSLNSLNYKERRPLDESRSDI